MHNKKTHHDRRVLLDRLEKKYVKKIQLQAFRRESEQLKHSLNTMRGKTMAALHGDDDMLIDASRFRLHYL